MSETAPHPVLDFHSPRRPANEALRQLRLWQQSLCDHVRDGWASLLARPVRLVPDRIEPIQYFAAMQQLPEDGLGVYFSIGESLLPSMMVFSSRQIQGLLSDLLDLPGGKWPAPARLTEVEDSMLELLFHKLADAISEGWPGEDRIPCRFLETTNKPQRTRLFPIGAPLLLVRLTVDSRFGQDPLFWLLQKEETERTLSSQIETDANDDVMANADLVAITERIPLDVVVELGRVELTMSQAHDLAVGDVLILDQLVSRPLVASVEGTAKWIGSPCRIGSRQAFEIRQSLQDQPASMALNLFSESEN